MEASHPRVQRYNHSAPRHQQFDQDHRRIHAGPYYRRCEIHFDRAKNITGIGDLRITVFRNSGLYLSVDARFWSKRKWFHAFKFFWIEWSIIRRDVALRLSISNYPSVESEICIVYDISGSQSIKSFGKTKKAIVIFLHRQPLPLLAVIKMQYKRENAIFSFPKNLWPPSNSSLHWPESTRYTKKRRWRSR